MDTSGVASLLTTSEACVDKAVGGGGMGGEMCGMGRL